MVARPGPRPAFSATAAQKSNFSTMGSCPSPTQSLTPYWSANLAQYLTEAEFTRVMGEFQRVTKPGGLVAVKDFDGTILQILPLNPAIHARMVATQRAKAAG